MKDRLSLADRMTPTADEDALGSYLAALPSRADDEAERTAPRSGEFANLLGSEVVVLWTAPNGSQRSLGSGGKWRLHRVENGHLFIVRHEEHRIPVGAIKSLMEYRA